MVRSCDQCFHIISRVVDRRIIFHKEEKARFHKIMRSLADFSGIQILSYCIMGNHFHILVRIPAFPESIPEEEIWKRMEHIYTDEKIADFRKMIEVSRADGNYAGIEKFFDHMRARMYNLSVYVQGLKQRFSVYYNLKNNRKGTLWEERFKSVLIEGSPDALIRVAAYIDLNPLRAGMVSDPKHYLWSSYGEAVSGNQVAQKGLITLFQGQYDTPDWPAVLSRYQLFLIKKAVKTSRSSHQDGLMPEQFIQETTSHKSGLDFSEITNSRRRFFTEGLILGSKSFIENFWSQRRLLLGKNRRRICSPISGNEWGELHSFRPPD